MKRTLLLASLILLAGGCHLEKFQKTSGSGKMKLEKRTVPAFTAVEISGAYDVEIVAQKDQKLEVEGDENLLSLIITEVKNGVLSVRNEKGFDTEHKLRLRISLPTLDSISTSGANDIVASNVKSDEFSINASGAGNMQVSGEAESLQVEISGAGEVDAKDLRARKVTISSSGSAQADVYASEELRANVSGAGNVTYYGDPKNVSEDTSGSGSISKK